MKDIVTATSACVQVLGSGSFGVVLEVWQLTGGRRAARRAAKLVHARERVLTQSELRRLNREVCVYICLYLCVRGKGESGRREGGCREGEIERELGMWR